MNNLDLPLTIKTEENNLKKTAWYAKPQFIKNQRIIGAASIAIGLVALSFAPLVVGATAVPTCCFFAIGGILIGSSLLQQVVGESPDAIHGRVKRVVAGVFIMIGGPVGWTVGGILWYLSYRDNKKI